MSDVDLSAIADRLYGGTSAPATSVNTETPAATSEPVAKPEDSAAKQVALREDIARQNRDITRQNTPVEARMWPTPEAPPEAPNVPATVKGLRDDPLRRMFSPQGTFASVPLEDALKVSSSDDATKAADAREWREVFADNGLDTTEANQFVDWSRDLHSNQPTPEADATNQSIAITRLMEVYGNDAEEALADARALVARDPRVAKFLELYRGGNDPRFVLKVAELARRAKSRGEL